MLINLVRRFGSDLFSTVIQRICILIPKFISLKEDLDGDIQGWFQNFIFELSAVACILWFGGSSPPPPRPPPKCFKVLGKMKAREKVKEKRNC